MNDTFKGIGHCGRLFISKLFTTSGSVRGEGCEVVRSPRTATCMQGGSTLTRLSNFFNATLIIIIRSRWHSSTIISQPALRPMFISMHPTHTNNFTVSISNWQGRRTRHVDVKLPHTTYWIWLMISFLSLYFFIYCPSRFWSQLLVDFLHIRWNRLSSKSST